MTSTTYNYKKMFSHRTSFLFFIMLLFCNNIFSQFDLRIIIKSAPLTHIDDTIFIAGSFNDWVPNNEKYRLVAENGNVSINITDLKQGIYPFKCTRGDWRKTETDLNGKDIDNRVLLLTSDTTIVLSIEGWKDDFTEIAKKHTASLNVTVLDTAFFMPQLKRTRRIWIYLPEDYKKGKRRYPVIYMNDGQNLFDDYTSFNGEWGIDECLDSLIKKGKPASIIIGIENGSKRINEYNPYDHLEYGKGEGEEYVQFLTETLKPFIDKHYRTLSSKENTIIAGSSLGALISYYAMLRYPDIYGKGGMFSPAFWIAPKINNLTGSVGHKLDSQFFFIAGEQEGGSVVKNMKELADKLGENSDAFIYLVTSPQGRHNENNWRKWFEEFYLWIMGNGLSYQVKTGN